jgi:hypothetical protein
MMEREVHVDTQAQSGGRPRARQVDCGHEPDHKVQRTQSAPGAPRMIAPSQADFSSGYGDQPQAI